MGWLLAQLPFALQHWLGQRIGDLLFIFRPSRTRVAQRNIAACFPAKTEAERERLLRENMRALGMGFFETLICRFGRLSILHKRFEVIGEEYLKEYEDRGVVLLVFHFSNVELCAAALFSRFPLLVVYRPHNNPVIEFSQKRRWAPLEGQVSESDQSSHLFDRIDVRGMVKALRQGKNIWIAADQDLGEKRTVFAPFFGIQTATPLAPSKLCQSGRAVALPVSFTRPDKGRYRIEILPPLEGYPTGDNTEDAVRFNEVAEKIVLKEPESYLWAHRRFKTRPEGEEDFYPQC